MQIRSHVRTNLILLLILLGLVASIVIQYLESPKISYLADDVAVAQKMADHSIDVNKPAQITVNALGHYHAIIDQPLFYPDRRPLPAAPKAKPPAPAPAPDVKLTLMGVFLTSDAKVALIRNDKTHKVSRVNIGEEVADWQLEQVAAESVTLRRGEIQDAAVAA